MDKPVRVGDLSNEDRASRAKLEDAIKANETMKAANQAVLDEDERRHTPRLTTPERRKRECLRDVAEAENVLLRDLLRCGTTLPNPLGSLFLSEDLLALSTTPDYDCSTAGLRNQ